MVFSKKHTNHQAQLLMTPKIIRDFERITFFSLTDKNEMASTALHFDTY